MYNAKIFGISRRFSTQLFILNFAVCVLFEVYAKTIRLFGLVVYNC